ncbi:MAG: HNH endonuclease [Methylococcales bacterium]|nr:HNH endonuclease [Methylococcales bacterium]
MKKVYLDKKVLGESYQRLGNLYKVAAELGVSRPVVQRELDRLGLDRKRNGGQPVSEQEIRTLYELYGSTRTVAERVKVSRSTVIRLMREYGLDANSRILPEQRAAQIRPLAEEGLLPREVAAKLGITASYVTEIVRDFRIPIARFHKGYIITWNGYRMVLAKGHPHADCKGYVREHRLVAEEMLGRYLAEDEVAHHIDGDKLNNAPENIEVMLLSEHTSLHHLGKSKH